MSDVGALDSWMSPQEALSRFKSDEMSLLDLNLPSVDESKIRYGFRYENIGFIIGKGVLSEVINDYVVYPMPNCSDWLTGLANVRGNLVPVYDLRKLFQLEVAESFYKHLLVIDQGSDSVGVLIEDLPQSLETIDWKPSSYRPKLAVNISEYIKASYLIDAVAWIDFDHAEFFKSIKDSVAV